tara:strand:+ start:258 stop:386 length:129 start_codon:yes stop_codon:yes gene_type:complete
MNNKTEYLIDNIYEKLKKYNKKEINLEKDEIKKFVFFLINNS